MRKHKPKLVLLIAISLLGVILVVVWAFLPAPPAHNLMERAIKLSSAQSVVSYSWLSNTELIVQTTTNVPPYGHPFLRWSGYMEVIDAQTHNRTRLDGLTAVLMQHGSHYDLVGPWNFTRSKDGQWLLWNCRDLTDGGLYPVTARTDGSGYHEWHVLANSTHEWIDGHRWITVLYPPNYTMDMSHPENYKPSGVIVHDAEQPALDRRLPASSPKAQALLNRDGGSHKDKPTPYLSAMPPVTRAFSLDLDIMSAPSSGPGIHSTKLGTVTFPAGTTILDNIPNSQSSSLEFLVREPGIPAYVTLLRKFNPSAAYKAHPVECLSVYSADRKEWIDLGCVDTTPSTTSDIENAFWLPDGKHIQFFYKDAVYIVTAD